MNTFSIRTVIQQSFNLLFKDIWYFVGLTVVVLLVSAVPEYFAKMVEDQTLLTSLWKLVGFVLGMIINIGLFRIYVAYVEGTKLPFGDLFKSYHLFFKYFVATIVNLIIIAIGFLLLILPGIYLAVRLSFYGFALVNEGLGPIASLKHSFALTRGRFWKLFGLMIVLLAFNLAGLMLLGVGLLVAIPLSQLALALVYRTLHHSMLPNVPVPTPVPTPGVVEGPRT